MPSRINGSVFSARGRAVRARTLRHLMWTAADDWDGALAVASSLDSKLWVFKVRVATCISLIPELCEFSVHLVI